MTSLPDRSKSLWLLVAATPIAAGLSAILFPEPHYDGSIQTYSIAVVISLVLLIVYSAVLRVRERPALSYRGRAATAGAALFIVVAILAAYSRPEFLDHSLQRTTLQVIAVLAALALFLVSETQALRARVAAQQMMAYGLLLFCLGLLVYVALRHDDPLFDWGRFAYGGANVRHLGYFLAPAVSLSIGLSCTTEKTRFWWSCATFFVALIYWSGGRGALLGSFVAIAAASLLVDRDLRRQLWLRTLSALLVAVPISYLYIAPDDRFGLKRIFKSSSAGLQNDNFSSGRTELWSDALELISRSPVFGYGEGRFRYLAESTGSTLNHPHNAPLQWAVSFGIPAALLLSAAFSFAIWAGGKRAARNLDLLPAWMCLMSLAALALIDGAAFYPYTIFLGLVCCVILFSGTKSSLMGSR